MTQQLRETVIRRLRSGQVEIVIATDVAARGLDVERISHVVNYDVPYDAESYVHRIGRTARAGRPGVAILFATPRETRLVRAIERFTGQRLAAMRMPTAADVAARRVAALKAQLLEASAEDGLEPYLSLVEELAEQSGLDLAEIAAAATWLASRSKPLHVAIESEAPRPVDADDDMVRLFIDAGREAGMRPADIVGAVAGESDIPGRAIGAIDIHDSFTLVEVPARFAERVLERMQRVRIRSVPVRVKRATPRADADERGARRGGPGVSGPSASRPRTAPSTRDRGSARAPNRRRAGRAR